jgi:[acyl-carrier-protein] S-malonyltransferase
MCVVGVCEGEAMQAASDQRRGGMVALVGLKEETVLRLCRQVIASCAGQSANSSSEPFLAIGNYLGVNNFVVSGDFEACVSLQAASLAEEESGLKVSKLLTVSGAFHTPLMLPAKSVLSTVLDQTSFTPGDMTCPVYANVTGDTCYYHHSTEGEIKTSLLNQLVQPVLWGKSMDLLLSNPSFLRAYEIGPGTVCSSIVKMFNRRAKVTSFKL